MRISNQATLSGHGDVVSKYQSALSAVKTALQNTERSLSMVDNFFYTSFDPINDFDPTTVYAIIPRITQVTEDEFRYIESDWRENGKYLKFKLLDDCLQIKSEEMPITTESSPPPQSHTIQKKITTWKDSCSNSEVRASTTSELIVVASLLDKPPNLGGLSRTCEVFGVKQLVISSRSITKDAEFKSLSMSSEKWVDFEEANRNNLQAYLLRMKEEGFHIVGAEQTSDSVMLNSYQFPKNTLLLLG